MYRLDEVGNCTKTTTSTVSPYEFDSALAVKIAHVAALIAADATTKLCTPSFDAVLLALSCKLESTDFEKRAFF